MRSAVVASAILMAGAAFAQHQVSLFHVSPAPMYRGTWGGCGIECRRAEMFRLFPPGSCAAGTFVSADIQVLAQKGIRVRPDAEFWPHNGYRQRSTIEPHSPWNIEPSAIKLITDGMPKALAADILSRVGRTSDFQVYYTGTDLVDRFGFKSCGD